MNFICWGSVPRAFIYTLHQVKQSMKHFKIRHILTDLQECVSLTKKQTYGFIWNSPQRFKNNFFSVRLLSVLRGQSFFSSPPQRSMTSDFEGFSIPDFIHYIYFPYLNSWEKATIFPFECSVLNKGTTGTIFITSYNAVLDWGLNPRPPALKTSTISLGYRGGGVLFVFSSILKKVLFLCMY